MNDTQNHSGVLGRGPAFWGVLFAISIAGLAALRISGAIEGVPSLILAIGSFSLMIPIVLAGERRGCVNPIIKRYNRRLLGASMGYILGLGIAVYLWNNFELSTGVVFAISLLPTLPTFVMIWAMGRYLVEEQDEYLRYRNALAALISLGMVLAIGIFWGFLEMFELVPHVWAWWVLPIWAIGLGVAQLWLRVRGA